MTVKRGFKGSILVASLVLTGCQTTTSVQDRAPVSRAPIPQDIVQSALESSTAEQIAEECRKEFRFNHAYEDAVTDSLANKYGDEEPEWAKGNFITPALKKQAQDYFFAYIQRRGIILDERSTFCAAGRAEVAEGTAIGKYLIKR